MSQAIPNSKTMPDNIAKEQGQKTRQLNYNIVGVDSQSLQIVLNPKQHIICKRSSILYYEEGVDVKIAMNNPDAKKAGFMSKIVDAGKAVAKGEKVFIDVVVNNSHSPRKITIAGPSGGKIQMLNVNSPRGEYFVEQESFLCASSKVHMGVSSNDESGSTMFKVNKRLTKLEGSGIVFVSAEGGVEKHELNGEASIYADPNAVFARSVSVGLKTKKISQQGRVYIQSLLSGRGEVYIQTHPTNKVISKIMQNVMGILEKMQKNNK